MFTNDRFRAEWLAAYGARQSVSYGASVEQTLDQLAAHLAEHTQAEALLKITL